MEQAAAGRREAAQDVPAARWLFALLLLLLLAPSFLLSYLPMTDLPQHLAIASILAHGDDPRFGFAAFYAPAWDRSLYALPYLVAIGLAPLTGSLDAGMRVVVVLALASLPLGVLALLRALGKPEWLALLALPLVYNRAFFWGFVNFQLALGFALLALAILVRPPRSGASQALLAVLCTAIVFTHPHGLLMLAGVAGVWLVLGERRALLRHALALSPLLLGALAWGLRTGAAAGPLSFKFVPLLERRDGFEESVLGGYRDATEAWLLLDYLVAWAVLAAPVFPFTRERWRALAHGERVLWVFVGANLLLFAVVPVQTSIVGELPMRHALIATAILPVLAARRPPAGRARLATAALALIALATIGNSWLHLIRFDREARGFDAVVERIPFGARLVVLTWDGQGAVMRTWPYWHFGAYAQARRGGLLAQSFARMFWNLPVRMRDDAGVPPSPPLLFKRPYLFDYDAFGFAYDTVVVRTGETRGRDRFEKFPYDLVFEAPPWQLWRKHPQD